MGVTNPVMPEESPQNQNQDDGREAAPELSQQILPETGPAEAIPWHGGEAKASREAFRTMEKADRDDLLAFLRSL